MEALGQYLQHMDEIRKRGEIVQAVLAGTSMTHHKATDLEFLTLQMRIILEKIALGSLILNREQYSRMHEKFATHWNARYIMRDIEKINPDFYPCPVVEQPVSSEGIRANIVALKEGYLTKDRFVAVYEKCAALLHATNPFGAERPYERFEIDIPCWHSEIVRLLNTHTIKIHDDAFYLIHMKEDIDKSAHGYKFERRVG